MGEPRYKPYGETRYMWGSTPTDRRFTGQRSDAYINLYEMGARWYDADLGRWISPDSIVPQPGNPQDLNRYSYTRNNPLKYIDPTGHMQACADGDVGGGCGLPGTWTPPPPPTSAPSQPPPPSPVQYDDPLKKYYGADYHGVTFSGNVGWLFMAAGGIMSLVGVPEVGAPLARVGEVIVPFGISVGVTPVWDRYGDIWIAPDAAWGKTVGSIPVSVDYYSGWINPDFTPATPQQIKGFVSGLSFQAAGGFFRCGRRYREPDY